MKNIDKKLERYSAMVAGVVASAGAVDAQVVYTDLSPDVTLQAVSAGTTDEYALDFNADSAPDVMLRQGYNTFTVYGGVDQWYAGVLPYVTSARIQGVTNTTIITGATLYLADALSNGNMIGASQTFFASAFGTMAAYTSFPAYSFIASRGNWLGVTDRYIGVEFRIGGNAHYGWIRCDVAADATTITIKDFAYESATGTAIAAGDMGGTSVEENDFDVEITNYNNNLMITATDVNITGGKINITNLAGQTVVSHDINSNQETINLEGMTSGIYMVTVNATEGVAVQKIYVR